MAIYTIIVQTGTAFGSGTDANVHIQLHGSEESSAPIILDHPERDDFESGSLDHFVLDMPDLGFIEGILIGHDNTGTGPGWFLNYVIVRNEDTQEEWEFQIQRWLATDELDGAIEVEVFMSDDEGDDIVEEEVYYEEY